MPQLLAHTAATRTLDGLVAEVFQGGPGWTHAAGVLLLVVLVRLAKWYVPYFTNRKHLLPAVTLGIAAVGAAADKLLAGGSWSQAAVVAFGMAATAIGAREMGDKLAMPITRAIKARASKPPGTSATG